jgi:hypothetical protein
MFYLLGYIPAGIYPRTPNYVFSLSNGAPSAEIARGIFDPGYRNLKPPLKGLLRDLDHRHFRLFFTNNSEGIY